MNLMGRLRSRFPDAINCSFGGPDPSLLPLNLIKRHWKSAFDDVTNRDLQYRTGSYRSVDRDFAKASLIPYFRETQGSC